MFLYASIARSDVLDLVGVDLRDGAVELDLRLAIERRGDVAVVRVDEVEPLAQLAVVALELEVRLLVVRVDLEHLLEALRREVRLEEVLLVQRREVHEHLDLLALGRARRRAAASSTRDELRATARAPRRRAPRPRSAWRLAASTSTTSRYTCAARGGVAQARLVELRDAQLRRARSPSGPCSAGTLRCRTSTSSRFWPRAA